MSRLTYAGIGSRETPDDVLLAMTWAAIRLRHAGFVLRSGGANGADSAFERGASGVAEIYLPWKAFNGSTSQLYPPTNAAIELAAKLHPNWRAVRRGGILLHGRNSHQILGQNLDSPSKFVLCWTIGGTGKGGTGQAIRLAHAHNVPVFDLGAYRYPRWAAVRIVSLMIARHTAR